MSVTLIHAKVEGENVATVDAAVKTMFAALDEAQPRGVRYACYRLPDEGAYTILLELADPSQNPLPGVAAFREFQDSLKGWLAGPPAIEQLTEVGSYASR
ncbi:MAG TPA: hypothetical protein VH641_07620 [Streptosporangiaceae bacterium]|jgi:hypothetical protein